MRGNIIVVVLMCILTHSGYSQNNVGIGTNDPSAKLEVNGDVKIGISEQDSADLKIVGADALIELGKGEHGPHGFSFGDPGVEGMQMLYRTEANRLVIEKGNTFINSTDLFYLDYDTEYSYFKGRMGIGTSVPASLLEVQNINDNAAANYLLNLHNLTTTSEASALINFSVSGVQDWKPASIGFVRDQGLVFRTHWAEGDPPTNLLIDYDGNVGIGTLSPSSKLELQGDQPQYTLTSTNVLDVTEGTELISRIVFRGQKNNVYREGAFIEARQDGTWSAVDVNFAPSSLNFYTQSGGSTDNLNSPRMSINGAGLVTIGDVTPADGHMLSVDGKVACEEVRVELSQNWPDYVFEHDYNLKSLEEVELYISKYGHLPGIPSASKIEKEGLVLGEMNLKMMEKIEELTLYLIELKEDNQILKQRIENLEKKRS